MKHAVDNEKRIHSQIKELIYKLPKEVESYYIFLSKEDTINSSEILTALESMHIYYIQLSLLFEIPVHKITPNHMIEAELEKTPRKIDFTIFENYKKAIIEYQTYLVNNNLLDHVTIKKAPQKTPNKEIETIYIKKRTPKKITSPDQLKLFKNDDRPYAKTTIDLKYSLDKEFNGKYTDYIYKIYDHEHEQYLTDNDGSIIKIKEYMKAREYLKSLYKK